MLSNPRLFWADFLRVTAIFLVLTIHLSAIVVSPWENAFSFAWWSAHLISSLSVSAVPWLVLLSGGLLLGKVESWQQFYKKRAIKIVIPWIFWVGISLLVDVLILKTMQLNSANVLSISWTYLRTAYWFIPALIQLYVVTPLLRVWIKKLTVHQLFIIGLLCQLIISLQYTYCATTVQCVAWQLPFGIQYLGYFLLGYACTHLRWSRLLISIFMLCFAVGLGANFWGTVILSQLQHGFNATLYSFISIPVFLMGVSSFILLMQYSTGQFNIQKWLPDFNRWVAQVSPVSFSIFFIHGLFLKFIVVLQPDWLMNTLQTFTLLSVLLGAALLFLISYGTVLLCKKVPFLRYLV